MTQRVRKGDYRVPKDDLERAEAVFDERAPRSRSIDRSFRGPITTDIDVYEELNGRVFDYPGVDTPTESPRQGVTDAPMPGDFAAATDPAEGSAMLAPEDTRSRDSLGEDVERMGEQGRHVLDALFGHE